MNLRDMRYLALTVSAAALSGLFVFFGIRDINPIILGDEYIYAFNSKNFEFFTQSPLGNYSNPLFELSYAAVGVCGSEFYSCAKGLNLAFLTVFISTLIYCLRSILPVWLAPILSASLMLSPMQVYASMFLPESMMFASIGAVLAVFLWAQKQLSFWPWFILGAAIAVSASVKPHSIMFALAIGIYMLFARAGAFQNLKGRFLRIASVLGAAILARLALGFILAGPSGIDFLGRYVNDSTTSKLLGEVAKGPANTEGLRPIETATGQFLTHFSSLTLAILAMTGLAMILVVAVITWTRGFRIENETLRAFVFLSGLALAVYVIGVALFSGWVSGTGDDHEFRVLMRYLDVLIPFITIAGLAAAFYLAGAKTEKPNVLIRWTIATLTVAISTAAFTDFFASKEVQIADAPYLAGLITSIETIQWGGVVLALSAVAWASFPITAPYGILTLSLVLSVFGGQAALSQYQLARGDDSRIERAGDYLRHAINSGKTDVEILATSRFDATGALFWSDSQSRIDYEMLPPQTVAAEGILSREYVLSIGAVEPGQDYLLIDKGQGFKFWQRQD